jgi:hypothetical protein
MLEVVEEDLFECDSFLTEHIELLLHVVDAFFFFADLLLLDFVLMLECLLNPRDVPELGFSIELSKPYFVRPVFFELEQVLLEFLFLFIKLLVGGFNLLFLFLGRLLLFLLP